MLKLVSRRTGISLSISHFVISNIVSNRIKGEIRSAQSKFGPHGEDYFSQHRCRHGSRHTLDAQKDWSEESRHEEEELWPERFRVDE